MMEDLARRGLNLKILNDTIETKFDLTPNRNLKWKIPSKSSLLYVNNINLTVIFTIIFDTTFTQALSKKIKK